MLFNQFAEGRFSAIAASFNPAFERDSPEAGEPLNFTLGIITMRIIISAIFCLTTAASALAAQPPSFSDYPVKDVFLASPTAPILNTRVARMLRTMLRNEAKSGPNFAGHFTLARWGCGAGCISWAIIDAANGVVWFPPFTVSDAFDLSDPELAQHSIDFKINSELIVANGARNELGAGKYYYRWHDNKLSLLHSIEYKKK